MSTEIKELTDIAEKLRKQLGKKYKVYTEYLPKATKPKKESSRIDIFVVGDRDHRYLIEIKGESPKFSLPITTLNQLQAMKATQPAKGTKVFLVNRGFLGDDLADDFYRNDIEIVNYADADSTVNELAGKILHAK